MRRYLPLLVGTLDFFAQHYGVVAATGTLLLFLTQALETYQCPFSWPPSLATCPANDHPTVAALHVLTERALALPELPHHRRAARPVAAAPLSLPAVPLVQEGGDGRLPRDLSAAGGAALNVETPELYSTHPFRYFSVGSARAKGRDLNASLACLENSTRPTCASPIVTRDGRRACSTRRSSAAPRAAAAVVERGGDAAGGGVPFPPRSWGTCKTTSRRATTSPSCRRRCSSCSSRPPTTAPAAPSSPGVAVRVGCRLQAARAAAETVRAAASSAAPRPTRRAARATRRDRGCRASEATRAFSLE